MPPNEGGLYGCATAANGIRLELGGRWVAYGERLLVSGLAAWPHAVALLRSILTPGAGMRDEELLVPRTLAWDSLSAAGWACAAEATLSVTIVP